MPDSTTQTLPPPAAPSRALARPVSEALLNEKVSLAPQDRPRETPLRATIDR